MQEHIVHGDTERDGLLGAVHDAGIAVPAFFAILDFGHTALRPCEDVHGADICASAATHTVGSVDNRRHDLLLFYGITCWIFGSKSDVWPAFLS